MSAVELIAAKRGREFVRSLIARAVAPEDVGAYAAKRWGIGTGTTIAKAAVGALTGGNTDPAAREFLAAAVEQSLLGRIPGLRQVPFNVRMSAFQTRPGAGWVPEGHAIPLSKPAVQGRKLEPLKVAGIIAVTNESLTAYGETVEAALQSDLESSVAGMIDSAFGDPANTGVAGERPASIFNSATATTTTASGDIKADVETAIASFQGNLRNAVWLVNPLLAVQIATHPADLGDTKVGANGGVLVGIPLVTSEHVPFGTNGSPLILLDASAVRYGYRGVEIERSNQATLLMRNDTNTSAYDMNSVDPAGSDELVNLWQTNTTAFKAEAEAAWTLESKGRAVVLTDADYSTGS